MDCYIGAVLLFSGDYAPTNFALCDGSSLKVSENTALYSVIGNKFGGNNFLFSLPMLEAPKGFIYIICVNGLYPSRD